MDNFDPSVPFIELGSTLQFEILLHFREHDPRLAIRLQNDWKAKGAEKFRKPYDKDDLATNSYFKFLQLLTFKIIDKRYLIEELFSYNNIESVLMMIEEDATGGNFLLDNKHQHAIINKIKKSLDQNIFYQKKPQATISNSQLLQYLSLDKEGRRKMFEPPELSDNAKKWIDAYEADLVKKEDPVKSVEKRERPAEPDIKESKKKQSRVGGKKTKKNKRKTKQKRKGKKSKRQTKNNKNKRNKTKKRKRKRRRRRKYRGGSGDTDSDSDTDETSKDKMEIIIMHNGEQQNINVTKDEVIYNALVDNGMMNEGSRIIQLQLGDQAIEENETFSVNDIEDGARLDLSTRRATYKDVVKDIINLNPGLTLNELELLDSGIAEVDNDNPLHIKESLNMSECGISQLPESFGYLTIGEDLNLQLNKLTSLPKSFSKLKIRGGSLFLSHNQLESLPEKFGNLEIIGGNLDLQNNMLTTLPRSFGDLKIGGDLYLQNNNLKSLPEEIGKLEIGNLDLQNNMLTTLPRSFDRLTVTKTLDLQNNKLTEWPTDEWSTKYPNVYAFRPSPKKDLPNGYATRPSVSKK